VLVVSAPQLAKRKIFRLCFDLDFSRKSFEVEELKKRTNNI
jgi:hypothetical protein